jgi:hypothetical protein
MQMQCPLCDSTELKHDGKNANGDSQYLCSICNNIFVGEGDASISSSQSDIINFNNKHPDNKHLVQRKAVRSRIRGSNLNLNNLRELFSAQQKSNKDSDTGLNPKSHKLSKRTRGKSKNRGVKTKFSKVLVINLAWFWSAKLWYRVGIVVCCAAIALGLSYSIGGGTLDGRSGAMFYMQAEAFLQGKTNLDVTWTLDLIPFNDKLYLAIPPLNGFLILPFVHFFRGQFTETVFSYILYAALIIVQFVYVEKFASDRNIWQRSLLFIFLAFGTMIFPCMIIASSWFNAVLGSCLFLSLAFVALYYSKSLGQDILSITFLAIASTGRFHLALILPVFILKAWLTRYRKNFFALIPLSIPAIMFVIFVMWWNWARFGNPFSLKYEDLLYADFFRENIQKYGFRNLIYIFPNVYHGIIAFPKLITQFPFFKIDDLGNGVLATSPLFIYILAEKRQGKPWHNFSWLCMAIIAVPVFTHCSTGWQQFGYRYFLDFFPFASFLLLKSQVNPLRLLPLLSIAISIWFNIWGGMLFLKPELFAN